MKRLWLFLFFMALLPGVARMGYSRGDKIIPQVADGPGWATTFDLTNVSMVQKIENMRLSFYKNDGSKWSLATSEGTGSDFTLSIGPRQTLRITTLGGGNTVNTGYAIIQDLETANSEYSEDFVLGISVFYTVSTSAGVADTVTVSVPEVTAVATAPMQMNDAQRIYSGIAIVNASGEDNPIEIKLYPENWTPGDSFQTATFTLAAGQKRSEFLDQNLFRNLRTFKGMAEITAQGPFSFLGLLQTRASDGTDRYATLVPVDKESLRRNSYIVLLQTTVNDQTTYMPLDIDRFTVDYFRTGTDEDTESWSWDLTYDHPDGNITTRYLHPLNGAAVATLGVKDNDAFDNYSLPELKALSYSTNNIDLSGSNLQTNFSFAVRTDLRNYAKVRIIRIINTTPSGSSDQLRDLILEVYVYR